MFKILISWQDAVALSMKKSWTTQQSAFAGSCKRELEYRIETLERELEQSKEVIAELDLANMILEGKNAIDTDLGAGLTQNFKLNYPDEHICMVTFEQYKLTKVSSTYK